MRPLLLLFAFVAAPAAAQSPSTSPSAAMGAGTATSGTASNRVQLGRPPAPLGSSVTLSDSIDAAAGLQSSRTQGGASLPATVGSAGRDGLATATAGTALNEAGRPAGAPLGTRPYDATVPR